MIIKNFSARISWKGCYIFRFLFLKTSFSLQISETLSAKGLSDEWISRILISLTLRKNDIKQSLNSQSSCIAQSSLKNFDWNAKVSLFFVQLI